VSLISGIKTVANDGVLTIRICSLLIYKLHLDLTSRQFPIILQFIILLIQFASKFFVLMNKYVVLNFAKG
jgi:hypothetical protein